MFWLQDEKKFKALAQELDAETIRSVSKPFLLLQRQKRALIAESSDSDKRAPPPSRGPGIIFHLSFVSFGARPSRPRCDMQYVKLSTLSLTPIFTGRGAIAATFCSRSTSLSLTLQVWRSSSWKDKRQGRLRARNATEVSLWTTSPRPGWWTGCPISSAPAALPSLWATCRHRLELCRCGQGAPPRAHPPGASLLQVGTPEPRAQCLGFHLWFAVYHCAPVSTPVIQSPNHPTLSTYTPKISNTPTPRTMIDRLSTASVDGEEFFFLFFFGPIYLFIWPGAGGIHGGQERGAGWGWRWGMSS